ncbi:hypothetical protein pipiens_007660 [Culex pipiens pipiens]|uniref:Uncharacterized protein n=1 Tax=Culex pipiens pipiens TaxID=38569 RepID=A0ABD1DP59_CULPP
MFAAVLKILKHSDGYVHFSDVCKTLERTLNEPNPDKNQWYEMIRQALSLAHRQGLAFKSDDDRYKFAVNLQTSEDPKLLTRIDALKLERQEAALPVERSVMEPVEEVAGRSGYAYRIVAPEPPGSVALMVETQKNRRSREVSIGRKKNKKRSRSRSAKGGGKLKK